MPYRVLFVDHTAVLGGGEIALFDLVTHIDQTRFLPSVLLFSEGPLAEKMRGNFETHVMPLHQAIVGARKDTLGLHSLLRVADILSVGFFAWRISHFIRRQKIDLVYTNSLKADIVGGFAARLAGRPVVWHVRDRISEDYLPRDVVRLFRWLARIVPTHVLANSEATLQTMRLRKGTGTVVPSGVTLPALSLTAESGRAVEQGHRIGLIGRLSPWKGQHIFIRAAAEVLQSYPKSRFFIIGSALFGEAAYEQEIRAQAEPLGEALEFTGFRADIQKEIEALDLVVHASTIGEPFGQVIIQGMAAGKPVIATDGGAVPELIEHGVDGFLVPMGDADALATAICRILRDPGLAQSLGHNGRRRVERFFTIETTTARVEAALGNILEGSAERQPGSTGSMPVRRPQRILFVDHTAMMGGAEVALFNLVLHLDRERFVPQVLLFEEGPLAERFRRIAEIFVLPLDQRITKTSKDSLGVKSLLKVGDIFRLVVFTLRVFRFIRAKKIDLVHTHSLKSDIVAGIAARLALKPVIWHVRDRISDDYLPTPVVRAFRFLARLIPTHTIGDSGAVVRTLVPEFGPGKSAGRGKFSVVHEGTKVEDAIVRPSAGVSTFGLIGRICPWKGQAVFIKAAAEVHRRHPEARFQIIGGALFGEREYEDEVRRLTEELAVTDVVQFLGFCSDVPERIAKLDAVVHASTLGEPFGQVIIEGMAAEKPVIATRGGGVPEIIEEGISGVLVPMGDAGAMARAMSQMIEHPDEALEMGRRGRIRVETAFRIEHTAAKVEVVFDRILKSQK